MYPWQTILIAGILVLAYVIVNHVGSSTMIERNSRTDRRRMALRMASMYLSPYRDIWSNLKLSNKYCTLRLGSYSGSMSASDTQNPKRSFSITDSKVHSYEDLWNMFCYRFSYNTTFDELVQLTERFGAAIRLRDETVLKTTINQQYTPASYDKNENPSEKTEKKKKPLDVNNASEVELTALPGISIVMAKKLVKKREEIGGFKSVNDVCLFLRLKPHMQTQLEKLICVKKMKGSLNISRYSERSVDI